MPLRYVKSKYTRLRFELELPCPDEQSEGR